MQASPWEPYIKCLPPLRGLHSTVGPFLFAIFSVSKRRVFLGSLDCIYRCYNVNQSPFEVAELKLIVNYTNHRILLDVFRPS